MFQKWHKLNNSIFYVKRAVVHINNNRFSEIISVLILHKIQSDFLCQILRFTHIYFSQKVMNGQTKKPTVEMFDMLKDSWDTFDTQHFGPAIDDPEIAHHFNAEFTDDMLKFCTDQLTKQIHRDDYRELLDLLIICLGGVKQNYVFKKPGASHHARWMAKAIYSLKIYLFRDQIEFAAGVLEGLREVCVFIIRLYTKAWFQCTSSIGAPLHDLTFIQDSIQYASIDKTSSEVVLKKISNQLWYISDETIGFAFFDPKVTNEMKKNMVTALKGKRKSIKRFEMKDKDMKKFKHKVLSDFVSANTLKFFERLKICTDFLNVDPSQWNQRPDWRKGYETCKAIRVVNDTAERGVKIFTDYNQILTKDEDQKQFLVKVVKNYHEHYPTHKRSSLM